MHYHIPNAQIKNVNMNARDGGVSVYANALPLRDKYEVEFSFNNGNPLLWDLFFGYGQLPRTGITICTDVEEPSLSDLRWAYIAAKARYEYAAELAELDRLLA